MTQVLTQEQRRESLRALFVRAYESLPIDKKTVTTEELASIRAAIQEAMDELKAEYA